VADAPDDRSAPRPGAGAAPPRTRDVRPVQSLVHAVDVLEALATHHELGVTELSRVIGLSKTAVYNILGTLESKRLVRRDPATTRYRLGWRLHELGTLVVDSTGLGPGETRPLLQELATTTHETAMLAIIDRDAITYIDRVESDRPIRMVAAPSRQNPLHSTASGKALLAHQPDEYIDRILGGDLKAFTPSTITDPAALREQLHAVQKDGYAICVRENEPDLTSISRPIRNYSRAVVAALTIAAPAQRLEDPDVLANALDRLREIGTKIEAHLGMFEAVGS
jgi:DNA-binding IclR family transcriptional regulator